MRGKRIRVRRRASKRLFRKTAVKHHKKNFVMPARGGIRM